MKLFIFPIVLCLLFPSSGRAGKYGEHKLIGDIAFKQAIAKLLDTDSIGISLILRQLGFEKSSESSCYPNKDSIYVIKLHRWSEVYSYGDLTGLSGDHSSSPVQLEEYLFDSISSICNAMRMHHDVLTQGGVAADDMKLYQNDNSYLAYAVNDLSHFYRYGSSLKSQLDDVDVKKLISLTDITSSYLALDGLLYTNAIAKYATYHTVALFLASKARSAKISSEKIAYSREAIFFNAFADHFLQDAFAAGHLVVRRSWLGSFIGNKSLHDLYNRIGLDVVNLNGQHWRSFGDGEMLRRDAYSESLGDLTPNLTFAIEATSKSISEIFCVLLKNSGTSPNTIDSIIDSIKEANKHKSLASFFVRNYRALSVIPLPSGTDSSELVSFTLPDGIKPNLDSIGGDVNFPPPFTPNSSSVGIDFTASIDANQNKILGLVAKSSHKVWSIESSIDYRGVDIMNSYIEGKSWFNLSLFWREVHVDNDFFRRFGVGYTHISNPRKDNDFRDFLVLLFPLFWRYTLELGVQQHTGDKIQVSFSYLLNQEILDVSNLFTLTAYYGVDITGRSFEGDLARSVRTGLKIDPTPFISEVVEILRKIVF